MQAHKATATEKLQQGFATFGALISFWRGRSNMSGSQLVAIASWAIGESSWLDTGLISRVENGRLARGASVKALLAFEAANRAVWLWQTKGPQAAWQAYGPHTVWGVRDQWMTDAIWLPVPEEPGEPLGFADLAELLVGRMQLPYLGAVSLGDADAAVMSSRLSDLLNAAIAEQALAPRDAMRELMAAYPTKDADRQSRLMSLVMGTAQLTREELEVELYAMAETLRVLRELEPGSYGPAELAAELSADLPAIE